MSTFIIGEVGANHNRDWDTAKTLINVVKDAGCDAVKFQTYSAETMYVKNTPDFAGYKNINKLIKDIELPRDWQEKLKDYCDVIDIEFMSTPFDEQAIEELVELGVQRLKIAAFESSDPRFVRLCARTQLPLIISLGVTPPEITPEDRLSWVKTENLSPDVTFLHCNSAYPTPPEDANLKMISELRDYFRHRAYIGLSDHTISVVTPALAVMLGAVTIEKHVTLSREMKGPDHPFALEPTELKQMVDNIRYAEKCIGGHANNVTSSEESFKYAMRSVVTTKTIKKGERFTIYNITTKRPHLENSIPAHKFYKVVGKRSSLDLDKDMVLMESYVC